MLFGDKKSDILRELVYVVEVLDSLHMPEEVLHEVSSAGREN